MSLETAADVLIIGSGIAGIRAAIEASQQGADVLLTTKGALCRDGASSWMAGNGFQAALYPPDSVEQHIQDTIVGGKYLNNQVLVRTFLSQVPSLTQELHDWGVRFARKEGKFSQIFFPGHSYPRSLAGKPGLFMGPEYRKTLYRQVRKRGIRVDEDTFAADLLLKDRRVVGAVGLDLRLGRLRVYRAKSTILASGGFMGCYELTTASQTATGDGHAMAFRAQAKMSSMEMIQFIPSATLWPQSLYGDPYPYLLWVSLHPHFFNSFGEKFLERYYPDVKDWATREAAARAMVKEVRAGRGSPHGGIYMSFRHLPRNLIERFLEKAVGVQYLEKLAEAGVDIRHDAIEVFPGAHYVAGGCWINERCETTVEGLYAVGEVGSGGKDGADRLGGNSIPFCLAMGRIAGAQAAEKARTAPRPEPDSRRLEELRRQILAPLAQAAGLRPIELKRKLRKLMSAFAFVERDADGLTAAIRGIEQIRSEDLPRMAADSGPRAFNRDWLDALEVRNLLDAAEMTCRSALMREESRGLHQRSDFPEPDRAWLKHILVEKHPHGMQLSTVPVEFPVIQPQAGGPG